MPFETVLLLAILIVVVYLLYQFKENSLDRPETDKISLTFEKTLKESGIFEQVGKLNSHAREIKESHQDISKMLRNPHERGSFGEEQLEVMLKDILPEKVFGVRKKVLDGVVPDAYIKTTSGILCIDSKFPLDNYRRMVDAEEEAVEKKFRKKFLKDVEKHLSKVEKDYLKPNQGGLNTAFVFIPSESVYYFLVSEEFDLMKNFASKGVQTVSPLTLGHKLQLIKSGIRSEKLSKEAEKVEEKITELHKSLESFEQDWSTLLTHIKNAKTKSEDVDKKYGKLKNSFEKISND